MLIHNAIIFYSCACASRVRVLIYFICFLHILLNRAVGSLLPPLIDKSRVARIVPSRVVIGSKNQLKVTSYLFESVLFTIYK